MKEINNSPTCERASDLIAFLYDETTEREVHDFKLHLQECTSCRDELASFGLVRESITSWRDEALSGFVSAPLPAKATSKSALAALRQFFDLSPLWLKAATGFAVLAFCALAVLAFVRLQPKQQAVTVSNSNAIYSQEDVNRIVNEALAKQTVKTPETPKPEVTAMVKTPKPKPVAVATQMAKSKRPLSRAERDQLAADLRLLSNQDNARLNLLADRINQ